MEDSPGEAISTLPFAEALRRLRESADLEDGAETARDESEEEIVATTNSGPAATRELAKEELGRQPQVNNEFPIMSAQQRIITLVVKMESKASQLHRLSHSPAQRLKLRKFQQQQVQSGKQGKKRPGGGFYTPELPPNLVDLLVQVPNCVLEVVEAVEAWRTLKLQLNGKADSGAAEPESFIWNGANLLLALPTILDFLDDVPEVAEWSGCSSHLANPFLCPFPLSSCPFPPLASLVRSNSSTDSLRAEESSVSMMGLPLEHALPQRKGGPKGSGNNNGNSTTGSGAGNMGVQPADANLQQRVQRACRMLLRERAWAVEQPGFQLVREEHRREREAACSHHGNAHNPRLHQHQHQELVRAGTPAVTGPTAASVQATRAVKISQSSTLPRYAMKRIAAPASGKSKGTGKAGKAGKEHSVMMLVVLPGERAEERMLAMERGVPVVGRLRQRTRREVQGRRNHAEPGEMAAVTARGGALGQKRQRRTRSSPFDTAASLGSVPSPALTDGQLSAPSTMYSSSSVSTTALSASASAPAPPEEAAPRLMRTTVMGGGGGAGGGAAIHGMHWGGGWDEKAPAMGRTAEEAAEQERKRQAKKQRRRKKTEEELEEERELKDRRVHLSRARNDAKDGEVLVVETGVVEDRAAASAVQWNAQYAKHANRLQKEFNLVRHQNFRFSRSFTALKQECYTGKDRLGVAKEELGGQASELERRSTEYQLAKLRSSNTAEEGADGMADNDGCGELRVVVAKLKAKMIKRKHEFHRTCVEISELMHGLQASNERLIELGGRPALSMALGKAGGGGDLAAEMAALAKEVEAFEEEANRAESDDDDDGDGGVGGALSSAALDIQRLWRGYLGRKIAHGKRAEWAIRWMQRLERGRQGRVKARKRQLQLQLEKDEQDLGERLLSTYRRIETNEKNDWMWCLEISVVQLYGLDHKHDNVKDPTSPKSPSAVGSGGEPVSPSSPKSPKSPQSPTTPKSSKKYRSGMKATAAAARKRAKGLKKRCVQIRATLEDKEVGTRCPIPVMARVAEDYAEQDEEGMGEESERVGLLNSNEGNSANTDTAANKLPGKHTPMRRNTSKKYQRPDSQVRLQNSIQGLSELQVDTSFRPQPAVVVEHTAGQHPRGLEASSPKSPKSPSSHGATSLQKPGERMPNKPHGLGPLKQTAYERTRRGVAKAKGKTTEEHVLLIPDDMRSNNADGTPNKKGRHNQRHYTFKEGAHVYCDKASTIRIMLPPPDHPRLDTMSLHIQIFDNPGGGNEQGAMLGQVSFVGADLLDPRGHMRRHDRRVAAAWDYPGSRHRQEAEKEELGLLERLFGADGVECDEMGRPVKVGKAVEKANWKRGRSRESGGKGLHTVDEEGDGLLAQSPPRSANGRSRSPNGRSPPPSRGGTPSTAPRRRKETYTERRRAVKKAKLRALGRKPLPAMREHWLKEWLAGHKKWQAGLDGKRIKEDRVFCSLDHDYLLRGPPLGGRPGFLKQGGIRMGVRLVNLGHDPWTGGVTAEVVDKAQSIVKRYIRTREGRRRYRLEKARAALHRRKLEHEMRKKNVVMKQWEQRLVTTRGADGGFGFQSHNDESRVGGKSKSDIKADSKLRAAIKRVQKEDWALKKKSMEAAARRTGGGAEDTPSLKAVTQARMAALAMAKAVGTPAGAGVTAGRPTTGEAPALSALQGAVSGAVVARKLSYQTPERSAERQSSVGIATPGERRGSDGGPRKASVSTPGGDHGARKQAKKMAEWNEKALNDRATRKASWQAMAMSGRNTEDALAPNEDVLAPKEDVLALKNGTISEQEPLLGDASGGGAVAIAAAPSPSQLAQADVDHLFDEDVNVDENLIGLESYLQSYDGAHEDIHENYFEHRIKQQVAMTTTFSSFDIDFNGHLDATELKIFLKDMGCRMSNEEVRPMSSMRSPPSAT
jgi:hypothetical protein